jgi:hydrogenase maturation protein HypF
MDKKILNIIQGFEISIKGLVQGVGFRPYIYRLAIKHKLIGEVDNRTNGVFITVEGDENGINDFCDEIIANAPLASRIKSIEKKRIPVNGYHHFSISGSKSADNQITDICPDIAVCDDCLFDLDHDPERINYPFTNCTNCGPRFSIIEALPYDRDKTSMKNFQMCPDCILEYNEVLDRRFHAQPVACNKCGPAYTLTDSVKKLSGIEEILTEVSKRINEGKSVAFKGMGGYQLICNALDNNAIIELRRKKHRDSKPFAVMFRDISTVKEYCYLNKAEENEITSWRRPIVILKQREKMSESLNSGLSSIGAILPYLPLHYLLFRKLDTPAIIFTSGNISDEPIIIDNLSAGSLLMPVAGSVVSNNRDIVNRTDDSVLRIIDNKISLIRRSRGYVPEPVDLCCNVDGIIALGAEQKNSFCIGRENQAIMSQHIGDLKNLSTYEFFKESINRFSSLFRFKPKLIACDLHPEYLSTRHAQLLENQLGIPLIKVQHHHAHLASVMAENKLDEKVIGVVMDGTGFGTDENIWGGEFMVADLIEFTRYTHFDYIPMPGGDKAVEEPWRMALSYLHKYFGNSINFKEIPAFHSVNEKDIVLVKEMIDKRINTPLTSGAGRIFDAVSSILGLCTISGFDSEAPMRLESVIVSTTDSYYPFDIGEKVLFARTFKAIIDDLQMVDASLISAKFHNTIARAILEVSERIRRETSLNKVVLSGGVFQNKYLLEKQTQLLVDKNFEVFTNHLVPANDGGVSLGQMIIASKINSLCV